MVFVITKIYGWIHLKYAIIVESVIVLENIVIILGTSANYVIIIKHNQINRIEITVMYEIYNLIFNPIILQ